MLYEVITVTDLHAVSQFRSRPQSGKWPDTAVSTDDRILDYAIGEHDTAITDRGVAYEIIGPDVYAVTDDDATLEHHVDVDHDIAPVITSYSIHYTKLYEMRSSVETAASGHFPDCGRDRNWLTACRSVTL